MKTISAGTYLPILQALILDGKTVCLNISGSSMAPFLIHQRDSVRLQRPEHPPISGDIVLYQRENGQFILHRICRIKNGFYYLAGDNQTVLEGPVPPKPDFCHSYRRMPQRAVVQSRRSQMAVLCHFLAPHASSAANFFIYLHQII